MREKLITYRTGVWNGTVSSVCNIYYPSSTNRTARQGRRKLISMHDDVVRAR